MIDLKLGVSVVRNRGKIFEQNFKASVPKDILYERFKDGTANFNGFNNENVRFQAKNVCDCFLFDGSVLLYLELKSHQGKSLPLSCIRKNQIDELIRRQSYKNTISGFLIEFSDLNRVFYINISDFMHFTENETRKSIPFDFCRDCGIEVEAQKLRTNSRYNISKMYEDIINRDL